MKSRLHTINISTPLHRETETVTERETERQRKKERQEKERERDRRGKGVLGWGEQGKRCFHETPGDAIQHERRLCDWRGFGVLCCTRAAGARRVFPSRIARASHGQNSNLTIEHESENCSNFFDNSRVLQEASNGGFEMIVVSFLQKIIRKKKKKNTKNPVLD